MGCPVQAAIDDEVTHFGLTPDERDVAGDLNGTPAVHGNELCLHCVCREERVAVVVHLFYSILQQNRPVSRTARRHWSEQKECREILHPTNMLFEQDEITQRRRGRGVFTDPFNVESGIRMFAWI